MKKNGKIEKVKCDYCNNISNWEFIYYRKWFILFFLPLFPVGRIKSFVVCPVCDHGLALTKEERNQIKYKMKHHILNSHTE